MKDNHFLLYLRISEQAKPNLQLHNSGTFINLKHLVELIRGKISEVNLDDTSIFYAYMSMVP